MVHIWAQRFMTELIDPAKRLGPLTELLISP